MRNLTPRHAEGSEIGGEAVEITEEIHPREGLVGGDADIGSGAGEQEQGEDDGGQGEEGDGEALAVGGGGGPPGNVLGEPGGEREVLPRLGLVAAAAAAAVVGVGGGAASGEGDLLHWFRLVSPFSRVFCSLSSLFRASRE